MRTRLVLLSAAVFAVASANATTVELFSESFPNVTGVTTWGGRTYLVNKSVTGSFDTRTGVTWTGSGVCKAPGCVRLGDSSYKGWAQSPLIEPSFTGTQITIAFNAGRTAGSPNLVVSRISSDLSTTNSLGTFTLSDISSLSSLDGDDAPSFSGSFSSSGESFYLLFSSNSSDGRVAFDNLVVSQALPVLFTPANLALDGVAGANDFSVEWDGVANAEGYSVKLLDASSAVVSSNDVSSATTTASFSGLTSSSEYTVVVVALGNQTTTDNSAAATLTVETAASAVAAPTLVVANTSWTAGMAGTSAVSAMLPGDVACTFTSVEMSDGSTATVANGVLSWTPPVSATASTVTATFHVTHGTDGWDVTETLSVAATPAPSAPTVSLSNAKASAFDATWSSTGGGPVSEYKVRAWTGRATPDDATGSTTEMFADYKGDGTVPSGWTFTNSHNPYSTWPNEPVDFRADGNWIATPNFGGTVTNVSFHLRKQGSVGNGSTFTVYGSDGTTDPEVWKTAENTLASYTDSDIATTAYTIPVSVGKDVRRLFFQYTKKSGNVSFGTFSVSGVNWPAADFLEGWGGARVSVGTDTSRTISHPAAGEVNYVEVTAVGPTGLSASTTSSIAIPARPVVISVH